MLSLQVVVVTILWQLGTFVLDGVVLLLASFFQNSYFDFYITNIITRNIDDLLYVYNNMVINGKYLCFDKKELFTYLEFLHIFLWFW